MKDISLTNSAKNEAITLFGSSIPIHFINDVLLYTVYDYFRIYTEDKNYMKGKWLLQHQENFRSCLKHIINLKLNITIGKLNSSK